MAQIMTTEALIAYCRSHEGYPVEASLSLAGGIARSSHIVSWFAGRLYDTGCDDVEVRTSMKQFRQLYDGATWSVGEIPDG